MAKKWDFKNSPANRDLKAVAGRIKHFITGQEEMHAPSRNHPANKAAREKFTGMKNNYYGPSHNASVTHINRGREIKKIKGE
jgi:hypothetical protein